MNATDTPRRLGGRGVLIIAVIAFLVMLTPNIILAVTAAGWLASSKRGVYEVPAARIVPLLAILVAAGTPG